MAQGQQRKQQRSFWRDNGLSVIAFLMFLISLCGQVFTGLHQYNDELAEHGRAAVHLGAYLLSGHFVESTFENWESEFLQMGMFVVLTAFLYQRGSAESKDPDKDEDVNHDHGKIPPDAPGPVKRGGWRLRLYENSLSIVLFLLFLVSFVAHWLGSWTSYNEQQRELGKPTESAWQFLSSSKLWFESFQNWQSEFLSVGLMIVLTIFLRQKGSAQSKPVSAPHKQTGD